MSERMPLHLQTHATPAEDLVAEEAWRQKNGPRLRRCLNEAMAEARKVKRPRRYRYICESGIRKIIRTRGLRIGAGYLESLDARVRALVEADCNLDPKTKTLDADRLKRTRAALADLNARARRRGL